MTYNNDSHPILRNMSTGIYAKKNQNLGTVL